MKLLRRQLNPEGAPEMEAVAHLGTGVQETNRLILERVIAAVRERTAKPPDA